MKTLEQLLAFGSYAGLGLLLSCTADNESKPRDSDTEYVSDDSGSEPCVAWEQTYSGSEESSNDQFKSVQQTTDGGYILAGDMEASGALNHDAWLVKIDRNGNTLWMQTYGGSESDYIYSVQQTTDGGYILAGNTKSSGAGNSDGWLIKTDANGNKQWEQTFGGSDTDTFYSVQQTTDGGYILAGYTESSGAGNSDAWLVKIDKNGSKEWEQTYGGREDDSIKSAQQTTDGGYILAANTSSSEEENSDGWLIKTDVNGSTQWEQTYGGNEGDDIYSVQQTVDGGYILAGNTRSSGAGGSDGWLFKTDENGNTQWEQTYGGTENDRMRSVQQTRDGGYVLAGEIFTSSEAGYYDGWVVKTSSNGNKEGEQTFDGKGEDYVYSVQQTLDAGYVMAGYTIEDSSSVVYGWVIKTCDL